MKRGRDEAESLMLRSVQEEEGRGNLCSGLFFLPSPEL